MILHPPEISTKLFSYHAEDKTFSAEISTLEGNGGFALGQVYDDACDEGFTLVSQRTGQLVVFARHSEDKDREGDIVGWWFESVSRGFKGFKVLVIND